MSKTSLKMGNYLTNGDLENHVKAWSWTIWTRQKSMLEDSMRKEFLLSKKG